MENKSWHCVLNNQRVGPLSEQDIAEMIDKNIINQDTMIWQEGFTNWFPLRETKLSMYLPKMTPPIPTSGLSHQQIDNSKSKSIQVDNTLVWILAFAPIVGGIIDLMLGIWISTLIINIGLSLLDEKKLEKQGIDMSQLGNAWLVPVYLYKRAKYFGHSMAYFIVWLVTFFISMGIPTVTT